MLKRTRICRRGWLLLLAGLAAAGTGCRRQAALSEPAPDATGVVENAASSNLPPVMPDAITGAVAEASQDILVKNHASKDRDAEGYRKVEELPSGSIFGVCSWAPPGVDARKMPTPVKLDLRSGKWAIPEPVKGEVEYYENLGLTEPAASCDGAIVRVKDVVKKGRATMLARANFIVMRGQFNPQVLVAPVGERVVFATYDLYPTDFTITFMGDRRKVFEGVVAAYSADGIKPIGDGGKSFQKPDVVQSESLNEKGVYEIRSRRHPWKLAYVLTVDNPYTAVANRGGQFTIADVPAGKWTLVVWHPNLKPVAEVVKVEVLQDRTSDVSFRFFPPDNRK